MRLPRSRIRTLMIVVAVTACAIAAGTFYLRSRQFDALALNHEATGSLSSSSDLVEYHFAMAAKYARAARRPWLAVPPDPPPPR